MDDKYESSILNLKIIAQIKRNGKLRKLSRGSITLEDENILVPFKRRLFADSRHQTMVDINSILNEAFSQSKLMTSSLNLETDYDTNDISDETRTTLEKLTNLYREFCRSMVGLENLKSTYRDDVKMVAKIELVIEKVQSHLGEITRKLPFIENNQLPVVV